MSILVTIVAYLPITDLSLCFQFLIFFHQQVYIYNLLKLGFYPGHSTQDAILLVAIVGIAGIYVGSYGVYNLHKAFD